MGTPQLGKKYLKYILISLIFGLFIGLSTSVYSEEAPEAQPTEEKTSVDDVQEILEIVAMVADTVGSLDEIVDKGLYYVNNVPEKGSKPITWIGWLFGIVGAAFGGFHYIKRKYGKKKK